MRFMNIAAATALAVCPAFAQGPLELAVNGDFETGDFTGWEQFPSAPGNISIQSPGSNSMFAGCIDNTTLASASLIKNSNIGAGEVVPGETVTISFEARGSADVGGVVIAEFFSELSGGGTSASEILGGGPLALDPDPNVWTTYNFTVTTGPDVSGGVTLQLAAITGGATGSVSSVCFDNASVTVERACGSLSVTGAGTPGTDLAFDLNGDARALAAIVLGATAGDTSIPLGGLGQLDLGLASPFVIVPVGFTDRNGDESFTLPLPSRGLHNGTVFAQSLTVGLDISRMGAMFEFCTSGVESFTISGY